MQFFKTSVLLLPPPTSLLVYLNSYVTLIKNLEQIILLQYNGRPYLTWPQFGAIFSTRETCFYFI